MEDGLWPFNQHKHFAFGRFLVSWQITWFKYYIKYSYNVVYCLVFYTIQAEFAKQNYFKPIVLVSGIHHFSSFSCYSI